MNIIYAEYNMYRNSIDIYTCAGYMLRIDCNKAEDGIKNTGFYYTKSLVDGKYKLPILYCLQ